MDQSPIHSNEGIGLACYGKKELSHKANLLFTGLYVATITYGDDMQVMAKRIRSQTHAAYISAGFLQRVAWLSLGQKVRISVIQVELGVELLLLQIKISMLGGSGI